MGDPQMIFLLSEQFPDRTLHVLMGGHGRDSFIFKQSHPVAFEQTGQTHLPTNQDKVSLIIAGYSVCSELLVLMPHPGLPTSVSEVHGRLV